MPRTFPLAAESLATNQRILVVDDEPTVREVVGQYLERDGFIVRTHGCGSEVLESIESFDPDLVVLDVMLPGRSGLDLLTVVRRTSSLPIVLLTARAEETDRVIGLELGADDYVVKPFSPRELVARIRSVLRRGVGSMTALGDAPEPLRFDRLTIERATREVRVDDEPVQLTAREFDLLAFLAEHPRQVYSRAQLLNQVWDSSVDFQDPATVTVHVRRVRAKIEEDVNRPRWIVTVFGVGYRFEP